MPELSSSQTSLKMQGVSDLEIARIMVEQLNEYVAPPPPPRPTRVSGVLFPPDSPNQLEVPGAPAYSLGEGEDTPNGFFVSLGRAPGPPLPTVTVLVPGDIATVV